MPAMRQLSTGTCQSVQPLREKLWLSLAILIWAAAIGLSWRMVLDYEFSGEPTNPEAVSAWWPSGTGLTLVRDRPTVVFFLHPKCPCTRASLAEFERLWVLRDERVAQRSPQLIVVATVPPGASADWLTTDTIDRATRLPGATLVIDPEGREAHRFGATTSGTVMWFDAQGQRLYAGGITASRGQEGDNFGLACLEELLRGSTRPASGIPVLGCRLCLPTIESPVSNFAGERESLLLP